MLTKILVAAGIAGAVAFGGAALGFTGTEAASHTGTATSPSPDRGAVTTPTGDDTTPTGDDTTSTPGPDTRISAERAKRIALARAGGGRVTGVERELEHGRWVWRVRIAVDGTNTRVDVDARTGEVVRTRIESDRDRGDDRSGRVSDDPPGDDHGGDNPRSDDPPGDDQSRDG